MVQVSTCCPNEVIITCLQEVIKRSLQGNIVATLTSMPYYASMNTAIQCLFTFDFMYMIAICSRSSLEATRYSPIYFYPTCSLKIILLAIVRIFFGRCIHLASGLGVCTAFLTTLGPLCFFRLPSRKVGQLK